MSTFFIATVAGPAMRGRRDRLARSACARHRRRRALGALLATLCLPLLASPAALAQGIGDSKSDYPGSGPAPRIGDTPAEFAQPVGPAPKIGDTPADGPGSGPASRDDAPLAVDAAASDVDALPIVLGGFALLVALGGAGYAGFRMRVAHRVAGRVH